MSPSSPGAFHVGEVRVAAGTRERVELPISRLVTGEWLNLGVEVVHGLRAGPAVCLSGAIHGDELDGIEIIREVMAGLDPAEVAGTVLGAPVVNVFGFVAESRYLPDRRDLNRAFPGREDGSMAARLAHLFMSEVVDRCQVGLDFHCGSDDRENLPQVRANLDDPEILELARTFAAPVTIHSRPPDGSLRKAAGAAGVRSLVYEAGEAGRFTDAAIQAGVAGTRRVLKKLGMIRRAPRRSGPTSEARSTRWVRAPRSGLCRMDVALGDKVKRRQVLGSVFEMLGEDAVQIRARRSGVVIGRRINPIVYRGEAVVHLASTTE